MRLGLNVTLSENGWPVLDSDSDKLFTWTVPLKGGILKIRLHNGSIGYIICLAIMLWDKWIEPVWQKLLDDWGYAPRPVRGSTVPSNHGSGTAADVNATRHPLGRVGTLLKAALWRVLLVRRLGRLLRWGGDYHNRKDEMHIEIAPGVTMSQLETFARKSINSRNKLAQKLIAANPSQRKVINS
jgi:hypothetical protein